MGYPAAHGHAVLTGALVVCLALVLWPAAAGAGPTEYPDVGPSESCARAVAELSRSGCIDGRTDGSFAPNAPITRRQLAKVLVLSLGLAVSEQDVCPFSDVDVGGPDTLYPDNYVAVLAATGIVRGDREGRFSPGSAVLRGQAGAMLARAAQVVSPHLPPGTLPEPPGWSADPWLPVTRGEAAQAVYELLLLVETPPPPIGDTEIAGVVRVAGEDDTEETEKPAGQRVAGATVRIQATGTSTVTDRAGRFALTGLTPGTPVAVTAWAPGYYIGGGDPVAPGTGNLTIRLRPLTTSDDPAYSWLSAYGLSEDQPTCQRCHARATADTSPLPFDEWILDAHASSARNERFLTMYAGTDVHGNAGPLTRYVWDRDYGQRQLPPDLNQPYFGPGYKLDFPNTRGNCACCHAPVAAVDDPYGVDPTTLTGVAAEGIGCDFCHKIADVLLDPATSILSEGAPGVLSFELRRPSTGAQFFAGPFDDVAPGDDTYSSLQRQSAYCAPCHSARFWGTQIYDSYGEWLASPYSNPETGKTCQDCHMPARGATSFARADKGGKEREPATVRSHLMPGAADEALLRAAVSLTATARLDGDHIVVEVTVTNDRTGHHVPSDSPLRQVILLVQATDAGGAPLDPVGGPTLPDWTGVPDLEPPDGSAIGDPAWGHYAGLPGRAFAKVLKEPWTGVTPSGAYWNPTVVVSDTRIPALASDTSTYTFTAPARGASSPDDVGPADGAGLDEGAGARVEVRLLYRRAFIELMEQKGWAVPDIEMARVLLDVVQRVPDGTGQEGETW